ncbi:hypothetical protein K1719_024008 [Acacia pycnantha]|nr:hypothetical protein K1719_024008 [Acacia pycnantha]
MSTRRASQLGFTNMEIIDCEGYSGGIWCLWDENIVTATVVECNHQFMHVQVAVPTGASWQFTVVYASPNVAVRRTIWDHLARLAGGMQGPWLVGGDFNGTLLHCERRSTANFQTSVDRDFLRWFDAHKMIDARFAGYP